jgi:ribosome biogenesis GTPase / thiamine phosphate phosphatase
MSTIGKKVNFFKEPWAPGIICCMELDINEKLLSLGYNEFFETGRKNLGLDDYPIARITAEYKEAYRIIDSERNEYIAKITGKHMYTALRREDYPAVGDWILFESLPDKKAVIRGILPRKTVLNKKYSNKQDNQIIATNIDTAFVVESVDRDFNLNRYERFLVLTREAKIHPIFVLNKIDLLTKESLETMIDQLRVRFSDIEILPTQTVTEEGVIPLKNHITKGKTYCFLGSSGVGKSTLINTLLGKDEIKTREISLAHERGTHTTTTREVYFMENGGILIDNPGTREVGISDSEQGIATVFDDIDSLSSQCKFSNCTHTHELGCFVLQSVKENRLDKEKYENYLQLRKESEYYQMTSVQKREKDRKFGKFVKKALQELKR